MDNKLMQELAVIGMGHKYMDTPAFRTISDPDHWVDFPFFRVYRDVDGKREHGILNFIKPNILVLGELDEIRAQVKAGLHATGSITKFDDLPHIKYVCLEEAMDNGWTCDAPQSVLDAIKAEQEDES
jgi:hypothetical protein